MGRTLLEILHRGDEHRAGKPREEAARALDRYELARASRADVRLAVRRPAGAVPDPAAGAERGDAAAAGRADGQPRPALGRGAGGGAGRLRGHRPGGDPRPVVRPRLRPVPRLRAGRDGLRVRRAGLGRGPGAPGAVTALVRRLQNFAETCGSRSGAPALRPLAFRHQLAGASSSFSFLRPPRPACGPCGRPHPMESGPASPAAPTRWSIRGPIPSRPPGAAGPPRGPHRHPRPRARGEPGGGGHPHRDAGRLPAVRARVLRRLAGDVRGHRPRPRGGRHDVHRGARRAGRQLRAQGGDQPQLGRELRRRWGQGRRQHPARP